MSEGYKIFYSWQSQRENRLNRNLIEGALEKACKEINDKSLAKHQVTIDQGAQGKIGAVNIADAILDNINEASIFIADVTSTGTLVNNTPTPNPNVLFELGYAWKHLGEEKIILVVNTAFGSFEDLPFDLKKRTLLSYSYSAEDVNGPADARNKLAKQFVLIIPQMLEDDLSAFYEQGLNDEDIELFKLVYAAMIESDNPILDFEKVINVGKKCCLDKEQVIDSTVLLHDTFLLKAEAICGDKRYSDVLKTDFGMQLYCVYFYDSFQEQIDRISKLILTDDKYQHSSAIQEQLDLPRIIVEQILQMMTDNDYIDIAINSGGIYVMELKPKLKRMKD